MRKSKPQYPNAGLQAAYQKRLDALVDEMQRSVEYWIKAQWRSNTPLAMDASAASALRAAIARLTKRWLKNFDEESAKLAEYFAAGALERSDSVLKQTLRDAGFSVQFKFTRNMQQAYTAVLGENVALIKSIPEQYMKSVETVVMQSVARGRDLGYLSKQLQDTYGVTKRRAALIARDQNNKATAILSVTRSLDLGITEGIWRHSGAGKHPRPEHVKASGQKFKLAKGMFLEGEWVQPGEAINCFPGESIVTRTNGCKKLWRRRFSGETTVLITKSGKTIHATPNHPILTGTGWKAFKDVDLLDDVLHVSEQINSTVKTNVQNSPVTFADIFDATAEYVGTTSASPSRFKFHGDVSDSNVDTIDMGGFLADEIYPSRCQVLAKFFLAVSNIGLADIGLCIDSAKQATFQRLFGAPEGIIRGFCTLLALLKSHSAKARDIRLGLSSDLYAAFDQAKSDATPRCAIALGNLQLANTGLVVSNDQIYRELFGILARACIFWDNNAAFADSLGNNVGMYTNGVRSVFEGSAVTYEYDRIVDKRVINFSHFVYNLENSVNWYEVNSYIVHNCRCTYSPVIEGFID